MGNKIGQRSLRWLRRDGKARRVHNHYHDHERARLWVGRGEGGGTKKVKQKECRAKRIFTVGRVKIGKKTTYRRGDNGEEVQKEKLMIRWREPSETWPTGKRFGNPEGPCSDVKWRGKRLFELGERA